MFLSSVYLKLRSYILLQHETKGSYSRSYGMVMSLFIVAIYFIKRIPYFWKYRYTELYVAQLHFLLNLSSEFDNYEMLFFHFTVSRQKKELKLAVVTAILKF